MVSMLDESIADLRAAAGGNRFELSLVAIGRAARRDRVVVAAADADGGHRAVADRVPVDGLGRRAAVVPQRGPRPARSRCRGPARRVGGRDGGEDARNDRRRPPRRTLLPDDDWPLARPGRQARAPRRRARRQARPREPSDQRPGAGRHATRRDRGGVCRDRGASRGGAPASPRARSLGSFASRSWLSTAGRWARRSPFSATCRRPLEDIKEQAGSTQAVLASVPRQVERILKLIENVEPPEECQAAHALLVSAAHLARNAAAIRREAARSGDIARAQDASSAAAGALMLSARARTEIQSLLRPPQLK